MTQPPTNIKFVAVLPHLRVRNANAISSHMTWGFPPPSAFTGFAHAIERKLCEQGHDIRVAGVAVVSHQFEPQVHRPAGRFHQVFSLSRNPIDKDGSTSAIVEEGRAHLEVTLLLAVQSDGFIDDFTQQQITETMQQMAHGMRLAGGSIMPGDAEHADKVLRTCERLRKAFGGGQNLPTRVPWPDEEQQAQAWRNLRKCLLPGFLMVGREALLAEHLHKMQQAQPKASALDALLDLCRLNMVPVPDEHAEDDAGSNTKVTWRNRDTRRGWLVPLPVGYAAISDVHPPGQVKGTRDPTVPFCFVESVLSLGEWINPLRLRSLEQALWWHDAQPEAGLYRLRNGYTPAQPPSHAVLTDLSASSMPPVQS